MAFCAKLCNYTYNTTPPPPREHMLMLPGGELNQPKWIGSARGGWEQVL